MTREDPQFKLRLPVEIRDEIARAAEAEGRTMTAEILHRLRSESKVALQYGESDPSPNRGGRLVLRLTRAMLRNFEDIAEHRQTSVQDLAGDVIEAFIASEIQPILEERLKAAIKLSSGAKAGDAFAYKTDPPLPPE